MATTQQPVYWVGQDGNVYLKAPQTDTSGTWITTNMGPASRFTLAGVGATDPMTGGTQSSPTVYPGAMQVNDPLAPTSTGQYSGRSGGTSQTLSVDPAVAAFLSGQIDNVNNSLGSLQGQQDTGLQNVDAQALQAQNRENAGFDQATRDYNTSKNNTIQDELTAKNNIDQGVRGNTTMLQRILGLAGSGSSSAATILAPYAASRVGNQQRTNVQTTYGRNLQGLDTSYGDTTNHHTLTLQDIADQQANQHNAVLSGIEGTRQGLLNQLAGLTSQRDQAAGKTLTQAQADIQPYIDQINASLGKLPALQHLQVTTSTPTTYHAPSLGSYNYDNSPQVNVNTNVPYGDQVNPYILPGQQDQRKIQGGNVLLQG